MNTLIKIIILILLIISGSKYCFSYDIEVIDYGFDYRGFKDIKMANDKIAVLASKEDIPGRFVLGSVAYQENGEWHILPDSIEYGVGTSAILTSNESMINIDSNGGIWVSGMYLYHYINNEWKYYFIDDEYWLDRIYGTFCIDKSNNIWVTSRVMKKLQDTTIYISELHKFDGQTFQPILKFLSPLSFARMGYDIQTNGIATLTDNRIMLHRRYSSNEEYFNEGREDLYIINQDGKHDRLKMQSPSGPVFDDYEKRISQIFQVSANEIWFCLDFMKWPGEDWSFNLCCSGIEIYENGNWIALDSSYGFETIEALPKDIYTPIYKIIELNENSYLVFGHGVVYILDKEKKSIIKKMNWLDILNTDCQFIKHNTNYTDEQATYNLKYLYDQSTPFPIGLQDVIIKDNKLWIGFSHGILIVDKHKIELTAGIQDENEEINISPNPASDYININSYIPGAQYQIFNNIGEISLSGEMNCDKIDISGISQGVYYIKLQMNSDECKFIKFIKLN